MPIINTVIAGGGTTPTGTIQITTNGTHNVTNYASADVQVPTTAPALYREFEIGYNDTLQANTTTTHIMSFAGMKAVYEYMLANAYSGNTAISGAVDMSDLTALVWSGACYQMFNGCTGLTSIDLSSLTTISGNSACYSMFRLCRGLTSLDLSSLTTISNTNACRIMFESCDGLTSVDFPSLTTIDGQYACDGMFRYCYGLTSVNLSSLTTVGGNYSCEEMFQNCTSLTSVDLSSLTAINNNYAYRNIFKGCTSLASVDFPSLTTVSATSACQEMFNGCTSLTRVSFYALDTNSFGNKTSQFQNMLYGVTGCTVHFPIRIQSKIGSWGDVTAGFGGTNTTVMFDIVCTLTGADTNTYTRKQKESTSTATAWTYNDTLYYTSGTTEPSVGDTIYSDSACTTAVTTISSIA